MMSVLPPLAALLIDFSPNLGLLLMKYAAQGFSLINEDGMGETMTQDPLYCKSGMCQSLRPEVYTTQ
jgi:hypothetical protein